MNAFTVKLTNNAIKDLKKLPKEIQEKIKSSLQILEIDPFAEILQFKKLKARNNLYRIRIGNYRVIYSVHMDVLVIIVIRVGHRKDVYRYLSQN